MKKIYFVGLLALFSTFSAYAAGHGPSTLNTLYTCANSASDGVWTQVGLVKEGYPNLYKVFIVSHDNNRGRATLIGSPQTSAVNPGSNTGQSIYKDDEDTTRFVMTGDSKAKVIRATIHYQERWDESFDVNNLVCVRESTVTFDYDSK